MKKKLFAILTALVILSITIGPLWGDDSERVNINTASADELQLLYRVGPKYADRIIEYRDKNGPFEKPEDIIKVPGIGQKTFERNRDRIIVEPPN